MKKGRVLALLLVFVLVVSLLPANALAAEGDYVAREIASNYFYNQLNTRAKAIYDKLLDEFGEKKAIYYEGTQFIDLYNNVDGVNADAVKAYLDGNKDLFNDFTAAKDALDLDHSELWWLDSGYLTFRVTQDEEAYHVLIGPGRGPTYLLGGKTEAEIIKAGGENSIAAMDEEVDTAINDIVDRAVDALNKESNASSDADKEAFLVSSIHDQITTGIHYRYEIQCRNDGQAAPFIRTTYGFVTHEGVCEAYARTLQVALTRAGVECVLIHGVQTKGTPEDHMWNAVKIDNKWYVVDATWDDPLTANYDGTQDTTFHDGLDGKETNTYLMVGQTTVGEHWQPSGIVSTGAFQFHYPTIEDSSYNGSTIYENNGFEVDYTVSKTMEDGTAAGTFTVTYNGNNVEEAREKGLYYMIRMYDYHQDGTAHVMDEWYYVDAALKLSEGNDFFKDTKDGLYVSTSTCEYIEFAVTTCKPQGRDTWDYVPAQSELSQNPLVGYFHGEENEIVAQTGMLYNVNANYEAPPYVLTQTPAPNGNATAGSTYHFKVTYDDNLFHILPERASVDASSDDYAKARSQTVQVRYVTDQENLHAGDGSAIPHVVEGDLIFDTNRDGIVDPDKVTWIYAEDCPIHHDDHSQCDVNQGCPIIGAEFDFKASNLWIDDMTMYTFYIDGVVGSRSHKCPNEASIIARIPGRCPSCYRSEGIDWNVWGQPTLLDAPDDLDLKKMAEEGGTDKAALEALDREINKGGINGRLMLVVEDKSQGAGDREEYERINNALDSSAEGEELEGKNVIASSVFEINFNRICPAVKIKPNEGQSIRVQVGYPAGVTYESLGKGEVELKAYHFTRCADNDEDRCKEYKDELTAEGANAIAVRANHKWGSHIISVEEISLTPTPYGMVLVCQAFSPFEIVAIEGSGTAEEETEHNVVVVSDGNGKVMVNGQKAVGEKGNVTVRDGEPLEFTVNPESGYVVDTVSFGGEKADKVDDNGTYKIYKVNKSDVLSVTFVPQEVEEVQNKEYGTTVIAKVCTHPVLKEDDTESKGDKKPTCTETGYIRAQVCEDCGQTVVAAQEIPALGHDFVDGKCTRCGATVTVIEDENDDYDPDTYTPDDSTTTTTANPDGSTTTTTTKPDGSKTETTTMPDGVVGKNETNKNGVITSAQVTIPADVAQKDDTVTAPIEVEAAKDSKTAPNIDVNVKGGGSARVEIPVTEFGPGTVAVVVHPDGTEEVVRDCVIGENGVVLNVEGNVTLKIVDNTQTFEDVEPVDHWATDAVEFVAARELFNGTGNHQFTPNGDMTRGMLVTVLYRLAYEPESGGGDFADVDADAYYADAVMWAENAGVVNGYGNSSFGPDDNVTREQLVTILYRYAQKNGYLTGHTGSLSGYADVGSVSDYAVDAMGWAVEIGLVRGVDDTHIAPLNNATRAQVATILMRFCEKVVK